MATKEQSRANKENARRSTGPRTADGKAKSSQNAMKHGLRAQATVLPDENLEDFQFLVSGLEDQFQPQTALEWNLLRQLADAEWRMRRVSCIEAAVFAAKLHETKRYYDNFPERLPEDGTEARIILIGEAAASDAGAGDTLSKLSRYEARLSHRYFKALEHLQRAQNLRLSAPQPENRAPAVPSPNSTGPNGTEPNNTGPNGTVPARDGKRNDSEPAGHAKEVRARKEKYPEEFSDPENSTSKPAASSELDNRQPRDPAQQPKSRRPGGARRQAQPKPNKQDRKRPKTNGKANPSAPNEPKFCGRAVASHTIVYNHAMHGSHPSQTPAMREGDSHPSHNLVQPSKRRWSGDCTRPAQCMARGILKIHCRHRPIAAVTGLSRFRP